MPAEVVEAKIVTPSNHKGSFFRQGGWMMITAVGGGALMFLVQLIAKRLLEKEEYSAFVTLIQLTNWMMIPSLGLQMVFAQQAAAATTDSQRRQLVSTMKSVLLWTFCVWVLMALVTLGGLGHWVDALKLKDSTPLLLTLFVGLRCFGSRYFRGCCKAGKIFYGSDGWRCSTAWAACASAD